MTTPEDDWSAYYTRVAPPRAAPAPPAMPQKEALARVHAAGGLSPLWDFTNCTDEPVSVTFGTEKIDPKRQCMVSGPDLRLTWSPGQTLSVPATLASAIHRVLIPVGSSRPICMGGQAPVQLQRSRPPADYDTHPSLYRNAAAEAAAVKRPKHWLTPKDGDS